MERIVFLDRDSIQANFRRPNFTHEWRNFPVTLAAQVVELRRAGADPAAVGEREANLLALRRAELKAIQWKQLWSLPAVFAAVILALFLVCFREQPK